jgi:hypothetical protein
MPASLSIPPAVEADYPELVAAGRAAFQADKERYGEGPSIYEDPSFLLPLLAGGDGVVRKMVADGKTIGVIITFATGPDTRRLGCLCLPPEEQNRGYGTEAIRLLEAAYPDRSAGRWTPPPITFATAIFTRRTAIASSEKPTTNRAEAGAVRKTAVAPRVRPCAERAAGSNPPTQTGRAVT